MNVDRRERVESLYLKLVGSSESGELPRLEDIPTADAELYPDLVALHREQLNLEKVLAQIVPQAGVAPAGLHVPVPPLAPGIFGGNEPALEPGAVLAGFELVRPLGRGGMGLVWQARQISLGRQVALKVIRPDHVSPGTIKRFKTEARAAALLNHPGLVAVLDTGVHEGRHWIAQELVEGGSTLRDTIEAQRRAPAFDRAHYRRVAELFAGIAEALQVAHEAGVVHRDIKPQNILMTRGDRPKVGDFGLAHLMGEDSLSRPGPVGTVHYMSPEQVRADGDGIDARSDVFSLGAVLYELLALRRPFEADSNDEILAHILNREAPDPRLQQPSVPAELAVIALGALEKDREDRYASMAELAADLRRFARDEPILRTPPSAWMRARKWVRRHRALAASIALGVMLAGVLGVLVPEVMAQRRRALEFHKESLADKALRAIDRGKLASALSWTQQAVELDAQDPRPHLYMAAGYAQYGRFREAEQEIEAALVKGYSTVPPPPEAEAKAHRDYGVYLFVRDKSKGFDQTEAHLARALELDPEIEGALYLLSEIRNVRDDVQGERSALLALRRRLEIGDDFFTIVEARLAELDGNPQAALDLLAPLSSLPSERLLELRYDLIVGRNQLRLDRLDDAQASLERMVAAMPGNGAAWENLAELHLRRVEEAPTGRDSTEELRLAGEAAGHASDWDPGHAKPYLYRAKIALLRIERRSKEERYAPIPDDLFADARARLDELRDRAPDAPLLPVLESDFLLDQALPCLGSSRRNEGIELLERSLEACRENMIATVILAAQRWEDGRFDDSLELCDQAVELAKLEHCAPKWHLAAQVWTLWAAEGLKSYERTRKPREKVEELLAGAPIEDANEELLSYAEWLATTAATDLQDCDRAKEVVEDYDLRDAFRGQAKAEKILNSIDAACP